MGDKKSACSADEEPGEDIKGKVTDCDDKEDMVESDELLGLDKASRFVP